MRTGLREITLAAQGLCCEAVNHPIECRCQTCKLACDAIPYLPKVALKFQEMWDHKIAVNKLEGREK